MFAPWRYSDEASLTLAALMLTGAIRDRYPTAQVTQRGCRGFTFFVEATLPKNIDADTLKNELNAALKRRVYKIDTPQLREMVPGNAAGYFSQMGLKDEENLLGVDPLTGLAYVADMGGEWYALAAPLSLESACFSEVRLCGAEEREKGLWRLCGCAAKDKTSLKNALEAYRRAESSSFMALMQERDLAITTTPWIWLPQGLVWREALWDLAAASLTCPGEAIATGTFRSEKELFAAHLSAGQRYLNQGATLPFTLQETISRCRLEANEPFSHSGLLNTHFLPDSESLIRQELTSSLQRIEKTYKMFCIEYRWVKRYTSPHGCVAPASWRKGKQRLEKALKDLYPDGVASTPPLMTVSWQRGPALELQVYDRWGEGWPAATLSLEAGNDLEAIIYCRPLLSIERVMACLLEQKGCHELPLRLTPEQLRLVVVSRAEMSFALEAAALMKREGVRVHVDARELSLGQRVFEAEKAAVPFIAIIGPREASKETLSLRHRGVNKEWALPALLDMLKEHISRKQSIGS